MTDKLYIRLHAKTTALIVGLLAILIMGALLLLSYFPSQERINRSTAIVEGRHYYQLEIDGRPLLYFSNITADSTLADISLRPDSVQTFTHRDTACWVNRYPVIPSCGGLLLTRDNIDSISSEDARTIIARQKPKLDSLLRTMAETELDLNDYLAIHRVTELGYNMIADYAQQQRHLGAIYRQALAFLNNITDSTRLHVSRISSYKVIIKDRKGRLYAQESIPLRQEKDCFLLLAPDSVVPKDAKAVFYNAPKVRMKAGKPAREVHKKKQPVRHGHGTWLFPDGTYYEGNWENGKRHGFGFAIKNGHMKVGEWKEDKFKGERLAYSTERIYGIDISRYQHESGKKRYAINWKNLRISHLGHISNKTIVGKVDYPVSFLFIKASQGITITNRYYAQDYKAARKKGIHVGSYHFFSVKVNGAQQAAYFLKNANFNKGDLPPVLDVEPSDRQIQQYGGIDVLLREVRSFCKIVEKHTGMRPILYVNQRFVNTHLVNAPDIKRDYLMWIARYGEYKPDVRLSFWQLAPDGRVNGIHGDVDINVFNGYEDKYQEFLRDYCIK